MTRILRLFNNVTKVFDNIRLGGELVSPRQSVSRSMGFPDDGMKHASFYICGPTVYSDSHLGHALTYTRADIFRRVMLSVFGVKLTTVMNITDIDDKILAAVERELPLDEARLSTDPNLHPFNSISAKYYRSFIRDMKHLRNREPDHTEFVSRHIPTIISFISQLEKNGYAYTTPNGDVYFHTASIKSYIGKLGELVESRICPDGFKKDFRDFALWKAAKRGEPVWTYHSPVTGEKLLGRPGWHVQCSAIASSQFKNTLDFHYGGRDLIFPHHYNEEACCCAFHGLDTSESLHVWSRYWIHSGHLFIKDEKMSKSLGNVVKIQDFIDKSSINALRLLCLSTHYGSNVEFSSVLMKKVGLLDHKLSALVNYLADALAQKNSSSFQTDIKQHVARTHAEILDGICDDLDTDRGLEAILELGRVLYNVHSSNVDRADLESVWDLVTGWCSMFALEYGPLVNNQGDLLQTTRDFRQKVRSAIIQSIKKLNQLENTDGQDLKEVKQSLNDLLKECDTVRANLEKLGFVERDEKIKNSD